MIRILAAVFAFSLAYPAWAACTWSDTGSTSVKVVCEDGDEAAPTLATEGLALSVTSTFGMLGSLDGVAVTAEADASQTVTSGTFKAYVYDDVAAAWARAPELDLTVPEAGNRRVAWSGLSVVAGRKGSRLAYIPSTVTLSSGGVTVYLNGYKD